MTGFIRSTLLGAVAAALGCDAAVLEAGPAVVRDAMVADVCVEPDYEALPGFDARHGDAAAFDFGPDAVDARQRRDVGVDAQADAAELDAAGELDGARDGAAHDGTPADMPLLPDCPDFALPADAAADGPVVAPDGPALLPDGAVVVPDAAGVDPDGGTGLPPDVGVEPDMAPPEPDMAPPEPDMAPPPLPACPEFENGQLVGNGANPGLNEVSGIVESRRHPGVFWVHNDSGDGPRVFAIGRDGSNIGVFTVDGGRPRDWEDIAVGPGPGGRGYIYVGDVGDNAIARADINVRRFPEPDLPAERPFDVPLEGSETITLVYPDGAHNCETLMVDPDNGDVYTVTKSGDGRSPVYRAAAPLRPGEPNRMERVADLTFGQEPLPGDRNTTGGEISPDGDEILVRTYGRIYLWRRQPGVTIGEAFATPPCRMPYNDAGQMEAICFAADDSGYYTIPEGANPPIRFYRRR